MASSLGAFLDVMYKKRQLEYEAALNQSKADVAGAQAIGQGISSFGSAIGSLGQGIGGAIQGAQQRTQTDSIARSLLDEQQGMGGVPRAQAVDQSLQGPADLARNAGAGIELGLRAKMGQFQNNQMTPYQTAQIGVDLARENRLRQEGLDRRSEAASRGATKTYTDTVANTNAYQNNSAANMAKLYDADSPEQFSVFRTQQVAYNQGAAKAGIDPSVIDQYKVPTEFIPKSTSYEPMHPSYQRYPQPSYAPGIGVANQRTTGVNMPPGAIPNPGFSGPVGSTANNGKYKWDGNFWIPNQ